MILDLPKEALKSNIHLIHYCHFRDCSLKIYSAEANISEKLLYFYSCLQAKNFLLYTLQIQVVINRVL